VVQLQGFVRLIDALGGLDINVPEAVYDQHYPLENGTGYVTFSIKPGKQHLNGHRALMYARSRHQDSDYGRMERQQLVVSALGKQLLKDPIVLRLPDLLDIARTNLWTNLKTSDLPDLASLAEQADVKGMQTFRFIPPTYSSSLDSSDIKRIRSVVAHVFDDAAPIPTPPPPPTPTPSLPPDAF
jgi:anionic cell wall polymer biosynthesis LytR-Cps2A-Psr (LCP) family protein